MSKKSRRRNRRLLMMAALAGGAALAGRGKGIGTRATISDAQKAHNFASDAPVTGVVNPNLKKAGTPVRTDIYRGSGKKLSDSGQIIGAAGVDASGLSRGQRAKRARLSAMNRVPPSMRGGAIHAAGYTPPNPFRGDTYYGSGAMFKKGGRVKKAKVTGIAKRGFGRALMKGKK